QFTCVADGRTDFPERGITHESGRSCEMRMVKGVERFCAKLQPHSFVNYGQREILEERHRNVSGARLADRRKRSGSAPQGEACRYGKRPGSRLDGRDIGVCKIAQRAVGIGVCNRELLRRSRGALQSPSQLRPLAESR